MKNKKAPVMLMTLVGAFVLGLIALNLTQYLRAPGGLTEIKAPNEEALEKVRQRQAEQAATRKPTQKELRMRSQVGAVGGIRHDVSSGIPEHPSILIVQPERMTPTFDGDSTSAHWYREDSAQKARADKEKGG